MWKMFITPQGEADRRMGSHLLDPWQEAKNRKLANFVRGGEGHEAGRGGERTDQNLLMINSYSYWIYRIKLLWTSYPHCRSLAEILSSPTHSADWSITTTHSSKNAITTFKNNWCSRMSVASRPPIAISVIIRPLRRRGWEKTAMFPAHVKLGVKNTLKRIRNSLKQHRLGICSRRKRSRRRRRNMGLRISRSKF